LSPWPLQKAADRLFASASPQARRGCFSIIVKDPLFDIHHARRFRQKRFGAEILTIDG